jgi:2-polyprenyl-3-methyl-5-hydroxy-6-metoxy-1,4-benzoquinol methylase
MHPPEELRCIHHAARLAENGGALICEHGCSVPIVRGIPRFVDTSNYAAGFGLQWNQFRRTQLDSYTHTTISRDRLTHAVGGNLDILKGKTVLEVGCGAGRFTEVMLAAGACVVACDLSTAVDANYANCGEHPNYFVLQADVRALPIKQHSFDFVVCLGVIQHTPSPEETITALARCVKPGGMLVIDHYGPSYPVTFSRRWLRHLLLRLPPASAKSLALTISRLLLPLHKLSWRPTRTAARLRAQLQKFSPLVDYYDVYPRLDKKILAEWSLLDTHDTLTDYYKHLRTAEEIERCLLACGLGETETEYAGNGVEARALMPLAQRSAMRSEN